MVKRLVIREEAIMSAVSVSGSKNQNLQPSALEQNNFGSDAQLMAKTDPKDAQDFQDQANTYTKDEASGDINGANAALTKMQTDADNAHGNSGEANQAYQDTSKDIEAGKMINARDNNDKKGFDEDKAQYIKDGGDKGNFDGYVSVSQSASDASS